MVLWAGLMAFTLLESPVLESQEPFVRTRRFYPMWRATSLHVHRSETRAQRFSLEFSFPLVRFLSLPAVYAFGLPLTLSHSSCSPSLILSL